MVPMNWFITGASSGIGRALALEAAKRGDSVALFSRSADKLEAVASDVRSLGGKAFVFPGNIQLLEEVGLAVAQARERMGPLDAAVSCAGLGHFGLFRDQKPDQWNEMIQTNFMGTLHLVKAVLPGMLERGEGRIGIVSSILGRMGFARMAVYGASKFALHGFVQGLRAELRNTPVSVTLVCPGTVETPFLEKAGRGQIPRADRYMTRLTSERVARTTFHAVMKRRKMVTLPFMGRVFLRLHDYFPNLMERMFYWF
jgi:3-oxoacyl-[acyl-carrier protein] reductase